MELEDDINTVSTGIELFLLKTKYHYTICGVVIDDIVTDIQFKYEVLNDLQIINISILNDKILDKDFDTITLFCMQLSHKYHQHSNKQLCRLALENILELIPTLYFDTLIGRFLPPVSLHRQSSKLQDATKNIFSNIGIKVLDKSQSCVVCYENTNCITTSNHALCFVCCSKIMETPPENDDEEEDSLVRCPICRAICCFKSIGGCN